MFEKSSFEFYPKVNEFNFIISKLLKPNIARYRYVAKVANVAKVAKVWNVAKVAFVAKVANVANIVKC